MATLAESFLADLEDLSEEEEEQNIQQNEEENNAEVREHDVRQAHKHLQKLACLECFFISDQLFLFFFLDPGHGR